MAPDKSAMVMDGIFDIPTIQKDNPDIHMGAFLVPPANSSQQTKIDWYVDGNVAMNNNIKDPKVEKTARRQHIFQVAAIDSGLSMVLTRSHQSYLRHSQSDGHPASDTGDVG